MKNSPPETELGKPLAEVPAFGHTPKPLLAFIAAHDQALAIGINNRLPWRLPADLARFKQITLGHPIIMGRKTWESIGSKPLPGRPHIVVSRNAAYSLPNGVHLAGSFNQAFQKAAALNQGTVFLIGGGELFKECLPHADLLYITVVAVQTPGTDSFFPEYRQGGFTLKAREQHLPDDRNTLAYDFELWEKGG